MNHPFTHHDIAIIGMSCRFPGADDPDEYWHNLLNGVESIVEFDPGSDDQQSVSFAAPLSDNVLAFDAAFFGISPRDAALMDPQHRIFLECAWHALESAGIQPGQLADTGLFGGCSRSAYLPYLMTSELMDKYRPSAFDLQIANDKDYLVSRTAWHLGLEGPVMGIQAACATSLVAVAEAVEALRAGRCRQALAGGCTIRYPQYAPYQAQEGMIYSHNGHCMPFTAGASGTIFGSGAALVVLKPAIDAARDGDHILAIVKGCAVNNDGARKVGFTTTSADGQRRLVNRALADAALTAADLRAFEAHGTGTAAGDPIEFGVLDAITSSAGLSPDCCALGAVKANLGHLETSAGMAGLIKAVLQIQHGWIAPQLHMTAVNPSIDTESSPLYFPLTAEVWPAKDPRSAIGVSAFGIGGTNAHIILARPDMIEAREPAPSGTYPAAIPISAQSMGACHRLIRSYQQSLTKISPRALAWSAQSTRKPLRYRAMMALDDSGRPQITGQITDAGKRRLQVVFLFPGQGSQFVGMGAALARSTPAFATILNALIHELKKATEIDLSFLLDGRGTAAGITNTSMAQPALTAVEIAMARFLMQHGIMPDAVIGHSLGEIAAACISGSLTSKQALVFAAQRGDLMSALDSGAMLAVNMSEDDCAPWLSDEISLAAVNGPDACVLSGTSVAIQRVQTEMSGQPTRCRELSVSHAFHSAMMTPILAPLTAVAPAAKAHSSGIRFHSTLYGTKLNALTELTPRYWSRHAREPVRFLEAVNSLPARHNTLFIEVGPGATLSALVKAIRPEGTTIRTLGGIKDRSSDTEIWHSALQSLWLAGINLNWHPSWAQAGVRVQLPHYPFERQHHGPGTPAFGGHSEQADDSEPPLFTSHYATLDEAVTGIWERTTGMTPSGIHNSLLDEGCDSLAVIQLAVLAEQTLGVKISVSDLMNDPTPFGLSTCLTAAGADKAIQQQTAKEI